MKRPDNPFAARARARRWSRRLRWGLGGLAAAAAAAGLTWLFFFSSVLAVSRVEVAGAAQVAPAVVERAARVPTGVPLARLDVGAIERRVRKIPVVKAVEVQRRPLHTVRLVVTERVAAAAVELPRGFGVLDDEGVVFAASRTRPRGLPVVEGSRIDKRRLAGVAALLQALPAELERQVRSVRFDESAGMVLRLAKGARVVWGDAGESDRKAEVLTALMRQKATVYDVSVPSMPTTRR